MSNRDVFEKVYAAQIGQCVNNITQNRDRDSYKDLGIASAWIGWQLRERDFAVERETFHAFLLSFFVTFRAFRIHCSPVARRRENEYARDARERMEKLFAQACTIREYDEQDINRVIDSEVEEPKLPVVEEKLEFDVIEVKPMLCFELGHEVFHSGQSIVYSYALVTGQHWFSHVDNAGCSYKLSPNAADSEYVDIFITAIGKRGSKHLLSTASRIQNSLFAPPLKTVFDDSLNNRIILRFMITHGEFLSLFKAVSDDE